MPDLLQVVDAPVAALRQNPDNPRTITVERFEALKRSIAASPEHLRARPLIAVAGVEWTEDGLVIAGNMRLSAVAELGHETVPTIFVDLDETTAQEWMLRDNQEYGEWEEHALAGVLYALAEAGGSTDLTGFTESDVAKLLASIGGPDAPLDFPELDEDLETAYRCPSCGYEWSGQAKPPMAADAT